MQQVVVLFSASDDVIGRVLGKTRAGPKWKKLYIAYGVPDEQQRGLVWIQYCSNAKRTNNTHIFLHSTRRGDARVGAQAHLDLGAI